MTNTQNITINFSLAPCDAEMGPGLAECAFENDEVNNAKN